MFYILCLSLLSNAANWCLWGCHCREGALLLPSAKPLWNQARLFRIFWNLQYFTRFILFKLYRMLLTQTDGASPIPTVACTTNTNLLS